MDFKHVADLVSTSFECVGVAVLVIGAILAFGMYIKAPVRRSDVAVAYHDLRRNLGKAILVGLELFTRTVPRLRRYPGESAVQASISP